MENNKPHVLKWIIIGALGSMGFVLVFIAVLFYMFTPLIKVDETTGRVSLFGGAVDVQARDVITQLSKDGSFVFGEMDGLQKLAPEVQNIEIKFAAGEIRIDYSNTDELNWDCDGAGKNTKFTVSETTATLDYSSAFVDCDISLPIKPLKLVGLKGSVEVRKMQGPLDITLATGDVYLQPVEGKNYAYNLNVLEGERAEVFVTSKIEGVIPVKVDVRVGNILPLDE